MRTLKNRILALICLLMATSNYATVFTFTDDYPKNLKIDAINYAFEIELSDETDEITCELTIDVRFLGTGVKNLRLDLVNASKELNNKGMVVSRVSSNGKALSYSHENDVLNIKLPSPSLLNQASKFVIVYKGIPSSGLKIGKNKYGDRTFFSDNWPNKARNWLATIDQEIVLFLVTIGQTKHGVGLPLSIILTIRPCVNL